MVWTALIFAAVAVGGVYAAARYGGGTAEQAWNYIRNARVALTGLFWLATALVFLGTGITGLVIAGMLIVAYIAAALIYDVDLRDVLGGVIP